MKDCMEYEGYYGSVHYSDKDEVFFGKIEFIRSLISYEGTSVRTLKEAFYKAVDDYLEFCEEQGTEPEKAFKGSFNIRVGSDLHREATLYAQSHEMNLNILAKKALQAYIHERNG
ncbi:MAG: type II toxin-antitoxin system HicB family antitoxin [Pseudomonadota bacterium]